MALREIEKQNKGWIYRFDLTSCKLITHFSLIGRAAGISNWFSLRQKGMSVWFSLRDDISLLLLICAVLCLCRVTQVSYDKKQQKI